MWKRLKHPNILPLLGITFTPLQLISSWMSGGDLPEYIKKRPDANRVGLVGVPHVGLIPSLLPLTAIRRREGPLLSSFLPYNSRRPQGSAWSFQVLLHHHINIQQAKHPCERLR